MQRKKNSQGWNASYFPIKELQKYTEIYTIANDSSSKYKIFIDNNILYFKEGDNLPMEFIPHEKDAFFMYENEKADISFKENGGKMYLLFGFPNEKPTRLHQIQ